jgi:galactokinase/mevalonate kinase-like predicted kinase
MAEEFQALERRAAPDWFASCDPPGVRLGSGGGTANLLAEAWRAMGKGSHFLQWLGDGRKLVLHGGGQSRRLPAYAPVGKLLMPIPVFRWARGQRLSQTLLDVQLPEYERVLDHAPATTRLMIASGDVLLRFAPDLPPFPEVDVLGLGMWVPPETAQHFGVFFAPRHRPSELAFFLQKPSTARIRELAEDYHALVDTGMWLLSEKAVRTLMNHSGWDSEKEAFSEGAARRYELYGEFGLSLGISPAVPDAEINGLTSAVVALPEAQFYHFGTTEQMIESVAALQTLVVDSTRLGLSGVHQQADQITQNSCVQTGLRHNGNSNLWIENSVVPDSWELASEHVLTGVPENDWELRLGAGVCLDFVPVGAHGWCVRFYGFRDPFNGSLGDPSTRWLGQTAADWFGRRGLKLEEAAGAPNVDIHDARLFPLLEPGELEPAFVQWLIDPAPAPNAVLASRWTNGRRLSAADFASKINLGRLYAQRSKLLKQCLPTLMEKHRFNTFFRLDLEATAAVFASGNLPLPAVQVGANEGLDAVHDRMFRSAVMRHLGQPGWEQMEQQAFSRLRSMIVNEAQLAPALPRTTVKEDQIVWARSPVRFDLAGGWTDTPPYCIEHGGKVLNVAANLNGQPPIQVFAKLSTTPEIVIRSIDLGAEERVRTFTELETYAVPGSAFALAKAALALAGFLPHFHAEGGFGTLKDQLEAFGAGIELSLLCAVPKGSGLGTSSILAATLLSALGDLCGLAWDRQTLFTRTLALEQMLTTGGGWQDQAGAIFRGIKLVETAPGLTQKPSIRWLPHHLFDRDSANSSILLYYTGITRMAKSILAEIVRGIFLNSPAHLAVLSEIGGNARRAAEAVQTCDYELLLGAIRQSWALNQRLDSGTNPPPVQAILDRVHSHVSACKLLGAGGGGYMLFFARDADAGTRIRQILTADPPNPRARFVDFAVSDVGLELTRS